jgi:hypothetical protein
MAPRGYISFTLECGGGSINSVKRSKYDRRVLLRLTEFILPPPHPSVKEMETPGGPFPTIKVLKIVEDKHMLGFRV